MCTKVCLIVIDGWGISTNTEGNAIHNANTPVMDALCASTGRSLTLDASGTIVGLPEGQMGNSEVGHINIGSGRTVDQDIIQINKAMDKGEMGSNKNFLKACEIAKTQSNGRLHLLGLVSDGGVHAHINHLLALLDGAKKNGVPQTFVHFFGDGRDTSPTSGVGFVRQVLDKINSLQYGSLATIVGRYYAMDRDKRFERIREAYDGLVSGIGEPATVDSVEDLIKKRYEQQQTDEFLKPIILNKDGLIHDNDTLVFIDYRPDRMRQIVSVFGLGWGPENKPYYDFCKDFKPDNPPKNLSIFTMTSYDDNEFHFPVLYGKDIQQNTLAEIISKANLKQFHCAETEKYPHVTYFFNGGWETPFPNEDRCMVPSPKEVGTYDQKPEMNAAGVASEMVKAVESGKYDFVMCNFANPDMVGHTGKYEPTVKACEATDVGIGKIQAACEAKGYVMMVTADHGNAEQMIDPKGGGPFTAHTHNRVPFVMTGSFKFIEPKFNAAIRDVAPTILDMMGLPKPAEMDGQSLLSK